MFKSEAPFVVVFCSLLLYLLPLLPVGRCSAGDDDVHQKFSSPTDWHSFTEPMLSNGTTTTKNNFHSAKLTSSAKVLAKDSEHNLDDLDGITSAWSSPTSTPDSFNRGYFHQMNALNHRPHQHSSLTAEESQLKPSISSPSSTTSSTSPRSSNPQSATQQQQDNVFYFSPSSYGARVPQTASSASSSVQFPKRSTTSSNSTSSGTYSPSRDQILSALSALAASDSRNKSNGYYYQQQQPQWSTPLATGDSTSNSKQSIDPRLDHQNQQQQQQHLPVSSYSNELNKLLLQKYVNRDLASMTALLGRYPPGTAAAAGVSAPEPSTTGRRTVDNGITTTTTNTEDADEGDAEEGDEDGEVTTVDVDDTEPAANALLEENRPSQEHTIQYYARTPESSSSKYNSKGVHPHPSHLEYSKGREQGPTTVLRVLPAATPRHIVRHAYSRLPPPPAIRYQAAHSHAVPHYYMPHGVESGGSGGGGSGGSGHHHLVHDSKHGGSTWLGGGLAAGILIGAIPFGIMMATMMPSLLTTALPIVNTATVAGRRRRRSTGNASNTSTTSAASELKNLLLEQTLDTVGLLLSRGLRDFAMGKFGGLSTPPPRKQYSTSTSKDDQIVESNFVDRGTSGTSGSASTSYSTTPSSSSNSEELLKVMARYALAAVDEPRCIKEAICTLVAGGRHPQTLAVQKVAFMMTKWIPKDIERGLGLNGLFTAIRNNACLSTYQCPVSLIDGLLVANSGGRSNGGRRRSSSQRN